MKLIIDLKGKIIESEGIFIKEGLNYFSVPPLGIVNFENLTLSPFSEKNYDSVSEKIIERIYGTDVIFLVLNNHLQWIGSALSSLKDIFYTTIVNQNIVVISDNFWEIAKNQSYLTLDLPSIKFFIKNHNCAIQKTLFKEVRRIPKGYVLSFSETKYQLINIMSFGNYLNINSDPYNLFKKAINSVFELHKISNNDYIFFSGGCDSGLIAAIGYKKFLKTPSLLTIRAKQHIGANFDDWHIAKTFAEYLGAKHYIVDIDYDNISCNNLDDIIEKMPFSVHLTLNFSKLVDFAKTTAISSTTNATYRFWTGQNADSLYNFQYSARGERIISAAKYIIERFYTTANFLETLPDVNCSTHYSFLNKIYANSLSSISLLFYNFYYLHKYYAPKNFNQIRYALLKKDPIPSPFEYNEKPMLNPISPIMCRQILTDDKLNAHVIGPDSRAIYYSSKRITNSETIFPYSATNMFHFFRNLNLNTTDAIFPKRYLYKYLHELIGKKNYKEIYREEVPGFPIKKAIKGYSIFWQKEFLSTRFATELSLSIAKDYIRILEELEPIAQTQLGKLLALYWIQYICKKLINEGTKVIYSVPAFKIK